MKPFGLIWEAEWNDFPCVDYPVTPDQWIAECMRPLANTQVDTLLYNLCSSDGFCCELEHGEILMDDFDKLGDAWVWRYRENTHKLIEAGGNPPALAVEYGHRMGLKVIPLVRMNDLHDVMYKYEVSNFKKTHPELLLGHGGYMDWDKGSDGHPDQTSWDSVTWGNFDYAKEGAREHKFKIIEEFITRWDNDGISLDFERHPRFFKEEGSSENAELMTGLIRRIRKVIDETASKRGRPHYFHVRVLPDMEAAWKRGLDVKTWVEEGLVDAVSPGCGYMTMSLDLKPWMKLVAGRNCWVYPSINHWRVPTEVRAWAKLMYQQGAHGLNLFNFGHLLYGVDKNSRPGSDQLGTVWYDDLHPCYYEVLDQIGDHKTMAYKDATYAMERINRGLAGRQLGCGDIERFFFATEAVELPITLESGAHTMKLPFAEDIEGAQARGFSPAITLRLRLAQYTAPDKIDFSLNGKLLDPASRKERAVFIMDNNTWIEYPVDPDMLRQGTNELKVEVRGLNPQMSVTPTLDNVELVVNY